MFTAVPLNGQTWLVCGGREFADRNMFDSVMSELLNARGCPSKIVHGAARGADTMGAEFGVRMAVETLAFPADWSQGRKAGPIRNQQMLDQGKPDLVVAFPGGRGTADMVRRARDAGVDVIEVRVKNANEA
jgi:YspA, cpYpsA-related SLOG family